MQKRPATLREVIGRRVREFRVERKWTLDDLAAALQELTGKTWSRQAISRLEKGRRAFDAAEVLILAKVLGGVSAYQLLVTDDLEAEVALTSTVSVPMKEIHELALPPLSTGERGSRGDKKMLDMWGGNLERQRARLAELERDVANAEQLRQYLLAPYALERAAKERAPKQRRRPASSADEAHE